jgi:hypothetical protein
MNPAEATAATPRPPVSDRFPSNHPADDAMQGKNLCRQNSNL